jgi:glycosyltransferase involved in cell wall biosynthesis
VLENFLVSITQITKQMKIVLFTHPLFLDHQSMPRYANMLKQGMEARGHEVIVWSPKARFYKVPLTNTLKKWLNYVDQYVVFPLEVRIKLYKQSKDTLFVFADQALGPWVPLVKNRKHVIHCHDFLALKSALGNVPENPTSFTGKIYQKYIRSGFSQGKNFISISKKTENDLQELHQGDIINSVVCYNGLNRPFEALSPQGSCDFLELKLNIQLSSGYIMHIGGNQYYKNRKGVIGIYDAWRNLYNIKIPLLLIGAEPTVDLVEVRQKSLFKDDIHFITDLSDEYINYAYSGASCLLFPSLDEGFGWPIIEAMASGCPVITTNEAPMNEVGGTVSFYIDKKPNEGLFLKKWEIESAGMLEKLCSLDQLQRAALVEKGIQHTQKFTAAYSINAIEAFYKKINLVP